MNWIKRNNPNHSLTPDIIIVNKKGMILKHLQKIGEKRFSATYHYIDFRLSSHPGEAFSRMLNELYNLSHEELFMQPDYTFYFNSDLEDAN